MKIEIWSDYVCPFCYIGKRNFEEALQSTGLQDKVEVVYKAYELAPNAPATSAEGMASSLASKYGISAAEANGMLENVKLQAQAVGLDYDIENMRPANTFAAHRLAKFAENEQLGEEMTEAILSAYFEKAQTIGLEETLLEIAQQVGLSKERVAEMLGTDDYIEEVKADIAQASQIGVRGVPFFVINEKYAISGAQPSATFAEALQKVAKEVGIQPSLQMLSDDKGICTDDHCDI